MFPTAIFLYIEHFKTYNQSGVMTFYELTECNIAHRLRTRIKWSYLEQWLHSIFICSCYYKRTYSRPLGKAESSTTTYYGGQSGDLKANISAISSDRHQLYTIKITATLYNIIRIFDTVARQGRTFKHDK